MKVRDCMCNQVECVKPETTVCDVAKLMLNKHIGCVPVCNANKNLVGLVTDRDLILRTLACEKDIKQTPVSEVMTTNVYKTTPEANVEDVSKIMCDCQVRRVPVVENEQVIGIITLLLFSTYIFRLDILPIKYILIIIGVIAFIYMIMYIFILGKKIKLPIKIHIKAIAKQLIVINKTKIDS